MSDLVGNPEDRFSRVAAHNVHNVFLFLQAVILARCTGAITVSSIKTLKNLLGTNPEWLEPAPHVGPVHDGGFLGLEVSLISIQNSSLSQYLLANFQNVCRSY